MVPRAPSILFKTAKEGKLSKLSIPKVFFNERGDAELKIVDGASNPNLRLKYRPEGITPGRGETVIREFPEVLLEGIEPAYQEFFGLKHDTYWDWRMKHGTTSPLRRPVIQPLKILETEPKRSDDF
ncbi:hypothetical protein bplSymb_SCF15801P002 [Bathymodiolus platifrons methanotrophic gill symbiont]|uniref:hypothetical protein n=1 Tax=Bathymodiolus platifrons methanotrophic gill symbiont TaxID=113268 RepID=UPI000B40E8C4|nr:hypothetical protein [Bathymodiolus platifrons methanotrophic gill symbiont]GAW87753.1 hypothetical protein bplSymb_SCF15801P002 [Bathymodiolus platifrons methanotrophic gill symbiont]GFO77442.1 hypothetical protein BPLS_P5893 [Bathymodiolus platifrons methanotrophic gill symbiont]